MLDTALETADIETSSEGYARRFSGSVGEWMLKVQQRALEHLIDKKPGTEILDAGGGHGQLVPYLIDWGLKVTVLGSSPQCSARISGFIKDGRCEFRTGSLVAMPFPDRHFLQSVSVRFISHCAAWPVFVREICRVTSDSVVIDYPPKGSFNLLYGPLFKFKKSLEGNTRTFTVFSHAEITAEFRKNGFEPAGRIGEFALPMVLHRVMKLPVLSSALEWICMVTGLASLIGSPVLAKFRRI